MFEAMPEPAGCCATAFRPTGCRARSCERDIERITDMGVKIVCGSAIGKKISVERLRKDYDAVFVGSGAWSDVTMGVPGEDARGVASGIEFLRKAAARAPSRGSAGDAVVVGGGNTAIDAARTALRLGGRASHGRLSQDPRRDAGAARGDHRGPGGGRQVRVSGRARSR